MVVGIINTFLNAVDAPAGFQASTQPNRGLLPHLYTLQTAKGRYFLPKGTWTCQQWGGSGYLGILIGQLPDVFDGLTQNGCCESYDDK
jgi:hypothetical protein